MADDCLSSPVPVTPHRRIFTRLTAIRSTVHEGPNCTADVSFDALHISRPSGVDERSPHPRFLRWIRNAFFVAGVLALGYSGFVLLDTKLYQAYQARRFQQQLEHCDCQQAPMLVALEVCLSLPPAGERWEESK